MCGKSWLAIFNPPPQFSRLGIQVSLAIYMYMYVCLSGLWLGGLLYLSFLSYFFKASVLYVETKGLHVYAHVFPCIHVCSLYEEG